VPSDGSDREADLGISGTVAWEDARRSRRRSVFKRSDYLEIAAVRLAKETHTVANRIRTSLRTLGAADD